MMSASKVVAPSDACSGAGLTAVSIQSSVLPSRLSQACIIAQVQIPRFQGIESASAGSMGRVKQLLVKAAGYCVLAGFLFGILVVLTVPYEMTRMVSAQSWPARTGTVNLSYANRKTTTGHAPYWRAEVCGSYQD